MRQSQFKDHFSENSLAYSQYRPGYPDALFSYLSSVCNDHQRAWDCATGTGQSAVKLSRYFADVIATDASETQIANAIINERVRYSVAPAEHTDIEASSVDLITVAQALHWFDIDAFAREAGRVLKAGGMIAVWTYNLLKVEPAIDEIINHFDKTVVGRYWPEERKMIDEAYQNISLPFEELSAPIFQMSVDWDLTKLLGYLGTWSAVKRYQVATGQNPLEALYGDLLSTWGDPDHIWQTRWPLTVRLWQKSK